MDRMMHGLCSGNACTEGECPVAAEMCARTHFWTLDVVTSSILSSMHFISGNEGSSAIIAFPRRCT